MITATDVELRAGARLLLSGCTFRVGPGDRVGLVGRNGAGKTTLTKVLAGEAAPAAGSITRSGPIGYLPQDPRTGDLDVFGRDRILSARGLDAIAAEIAKLTIRLSEDPDDERALARYGKLEDRFTSLGGIRRRGGRGPDRREPGVAGAGPFPAAAHPVGWTAPPGRTGPHSF